MPEMRFEDKIDRPGRGTDSGVEKSCVAAPERPTRPALLAQTPIDRPATTPSLGPGRTGARVSVVRRIAVAGRTTRFVLRARA